MPNPETGTAADIACHAGSGAGRATVGRSAVTLPLRVPLGRPPLVSITLREQGGRVSRSLAVRGRHGQNAAAYGKLERATCRADLPSPTPSAAAG